MAKKRRQLAYVMNVVPDLMDKTKDKIWIFLMNIFSNTCHQRADRSFFVNKYQFPMCTRCTGLLGGYILGLILVILGNEINIFLNIMFIIIMLIDWLVQYKGIRMSNNFRRLFTGLLCGIGIIGILSKILCYIL